MRVSGMTMRAIAAELKCSVGTVHNAVKALEAEQPTETA